MYKDYAVCANGAMFRKDIKGFMPELMEKMYAERKIFKKKMLQAKQEYEKKPSIQLEKDIAKYNNFQSPVRRHRTLLWCNWKPISFLQIHNGSHHTFVKHLFVGLKIR